METGREEGNGGRATAVHGGGRDPSMSDGNTGKSDTSASEPWPPGHQKRKGSLKVPKVAGSLLGRVPLGEGELSHGGLMVKRRKEAGVLQENLPDSAGIQPLPPHEGKCL